MTTAADRSLSGLLTDRAAPAFVFDGAAVTAADFARKVDQTTAWLCAHDIGKGDCIAVWLVNRVEWLALLFAAARIGAVVAAVNTRYRAADVAHVVGLSGAKMLVLEPGFRSIDFPAILAGVDTSAVPALQTLAIVGDAPADMNAHWPGLRFDAFSRGYPAPELAAEDHDAPVLLFTTSGTTKGPKLVAHSQATLSSHARSIAAAMRLKAGRHRLLAMLPFCGTFGLASLLAFVAAGVTVHAVDAFDAPVALRVLVYEKITHSFGSDEMFRRILAQTDAPRPFPHAEVFGFAAFQPGWREFAVEADRRGLPMRGLYGSSEVQALFSIGRAEAPFADRIEGGGWPMSPAAVVRIRNADTGELVGPGISGDIEIDAPSRFLGYYRNPEATAEATTSDGFFRTGDIGRIRSDGSFIYETRAGDAMRLGGFLVGPGEIEDELKNCAGVADAQVVAVAIKGQARCVAFVIPAPGAALDEAALIAHVREKLAGYKVPARVFPIDAFPVTDSANGVKIQRAKLRDMAMAAIGAG